MKTKAPTQNNPLGHSLARAIHRPSGPSFLPHRLTVHHHIVGLHYLYLCRRQATRTGRTLVGRSQGTKTAPLRLYGTFRVSVRPSITFRATGRSERGRRRRPRESDSRRKRVLERASSIGLPPALFYILYRPEQGKRPTYFIPFHPFHQITGCGTVKGKRPVESVERSAIVLSGGLGPSPMIVRTIDCRSPSPINFARLIGDDSR